MFKLFEKPETTVQEKDGKDNSEEIVIASLEKHDLKEKISKDLIDRLVLIEKESKFNEDSRKIEIGMGNIFDFLEKKYSKDHVQLKLTKEQKAEARIAAIFHDIGKSGPAESTPEEQEIIIKIFASENINDPNLPVMEAASKIFNEQEIEKAKTTLRNCDFNEKTTMRQFWDMHAFWTHDILEKYSEDLSKNIRIIAASHHINHGINPYNLLESEAPLASSVIGTMENYIEVLERRILIALDQYEASIRRGKLSHEEAINWVRKNLKQFENDPIMSLLLDAIDELGKQGKIFISENNISSK